jgi:acyl-coenzyme A synthetase/AMP-(fatty) acid ligase
VAVVIYPLLLTASSEPTARRMQRLLCPTVTGWGMTEIGCGVTRSFLDSPEDDRCLASGGALPGYACKVIDQATGATVPCGTFGELCVRGSNLVTISLTPVRSELDCT